MRLVRADWMNRGLRLQDAAAMLNSPRASLSAIMSKKERYLGINMASRMAEAFGYDPTFLLSGVGELFKAEAGTTEQPGSYAVVVAALEAVQEALRVQNARIERLENIVGGGAINADYQALMKVIAS